MRRHKRPAHGTLEDYSEDTAECLQYGKGQGKGSSPPTWLLVSLLQLRTLQRYTSRAVFECARRILRTKLIEYGYVDNKDLPLTSSQWGLGFQEEERRVAENLERVTQVWERLLYTSGGVLAFEKYFGGLSRGFGWRGIPNQPQLQSAQAR